MRLELPDGQWAELRERITHAQSKRITKATNEDDLGFADQVVREFTIAWSVRDVDGAPIVLEDVDAIDRMPQETFDTLLDAIVQLRKNRLDMGPTPPSSDG